MRTDIGALVNAIKTVEEAKGAITTVGRVLKESSSEAVAGICASEIMTIQSRFAQDRDVQELGRTALRLLETTIIPTLPS